MSSGRFRHALLGGLACAVALTGIAGASADERRAAACANATTPSSAITQAEARTAVTCLINRNRGGRRKLRLRDSLNAPARKHSVTMLANRCLAHQCPGEPPRLAQRLTRYLKGAANVHIGEVIAANLSRVTPRAIVNQWLGSADHRKLVLGRFEHIGVGIATGGGAVYYTADLGSKD